MSFEHKHNENNQEDNNDGHDHNYSFNCGVEGPSDDPAVLRERSKQRRNMVASLLLAQGVPMLLGGDEIGRTQGGNNNAYCQDNPISWYDWTHRDDEFLKFVQALTEVRRRFGEIRCRHYIHGIDEADHHGLDAISWYHWEGRAMRPGDWRAHDQYAVGLLLHGEEVFDDPDASLIYVFFNGAREALTAKLPDVPRPGCWQLTLTSAVDDALSPGSPIVDQLVIEELSIYVFNFENT